MDENLHPKGSGLNQNSTTLLSTLSRTNEFPAPFGPHVQEHHFSPEGPNSFEHPVGCDGDKDRLQSPSLSREPTRSRKNYGRRVVRLQRMPGSNTNIGKPQRLVPMGSSENMYRNDLQYEDIFDEFVKNSIDTTPRSRSSMPSVQVQGMGSLHVHAQHDLLRDPSLDNTGRNYKRNLLEANQQARTV